MLSMTAADKRNRSVPSQFKSDISVRSWKRINKFFGQLRSCKLSKEIFSTLLGERIITHFVEPNGSQRNPLFKQITRVSSINIHNDSLDLNYLSDAAFTGR